MLHPLLGSLSDKTDDEIQKTITSLTGKQSFIYGTQNSSLINQFNMVLESYRTEYNKRLDELYKKNKMGSPINITKKV